MGLARELERRLERLVDGVSTAIFRGKVHPVDLGTRIIREADLNVTEGLTGPTAPNDFELALNPEDLESAGYSDRLEAELAYTLARTAADRGWRLNGPPRVTVGADPSVKPSHLKMASRTVPGDHKPWGQLIGGPGRHADIGPNRVLVGRAVECDILVSEPEVSRRHAIIHREQGRTWVTDLDSANGTTVDGAVVSSTTALRPGARLTIGPASFMFRLVDH